MSSTQKLAPTGGKASRKKDQKTEAEVHFDLYHRLMKVIELGKEIDGITFADIKPEHKVNGGFVDLAVFDNKGKVWCVIEAKRYDGKKISRHIDPNAPVVVKQAAGYAIQSGAPYFATYNGYQATLFKTAEKFIPLTERKGKPYDVKNIGRDKFALQLLLDLVALEKQAIGWAALDEQFIARLRSLHHYIFVPLYESLHERLKASPKFRGTYKKWVEEQGYDFDEPLTHQYMAAEGAYLLINKIVFYKVLERKYGKGLISPLRAVKDVSKFSQTIREQFNDVLEIDYRAIFNRDRIYDQIPLTTSVAQSLNEFIGEIEDYDVEALSSDVIGRVYENLIPPEERHDLGQYYTPPTICELIVKHVIHSSEQIVLDPACGSGGFLVQAYDHLSNLAGGGGKHTNLIKQIWGVDINRFPAHLAAINMTLKNIDAESDDIRIFVGDFFDVEPKPQITLPWLADPKAAVRQADLDEAEGKELGQYFPGFFDAVVANPPYIRQEQIVDKEKVRKHLDTPRDFSSRSDIYLYFFTHATEFLKQGAPLGFIVSNRWLFTEYGEDLQKFFLKNYLIEAVILLEHQQFRVPLIGTCIVFLRKRTDTYEFMSEKGKQAQVDMDAGVARAENPVKFIRLHGDISVDELLRVIEKESLPEQKPIERPDYSLYCIRQKALAQCTKWTRFFAPKVVHDLLERPEFVELHEIFDTEFGIKTGLNTFFYMKKEEAEERGIPLKYLRPLIKSIGQVQYVEFREEDTEWYVLDLHSHIENILEQKKFRKLKEKEITHAVIGAFGKTDADGLADYLEDGERRKVHEIPSVAGRPIWFDLGELTIPPLIFPKEYWKQSFCCTNPDGVALDQHLYPLVPKISAEADLLAGIMNCALVPLLREIYGREASGEALNRNEFTVAEAKKLPVVDPRKILGEHQKRIAEALEDLVNNERTADDAQLNSLREKLDSAVLESIGMGERLQEVYDAVGEYLKRRTQAGGMQKRVLIY